MPAFADLLALLILAVLAWPARASAFCGFYVSGSGGPLLNDATQVVLMRHGLRTVLSMQNDYRGPPEGFALVVPVPVVLQKENVRTLPRVIFDRIEALDAPRLVEYWEQDPCTGPDNADDKEGGTGTRARGAEGSMGHGASRPLVTVEAEFAVDEYEIVILSALSAVALDTWLHDSGYRVPAGADRFLRPYVEAGSRFFVARVDPRKVRFTWGRATLSPLRFFYDSESFALPVRLGLMNADGPQDLVVHILAEGRYEVANYENLFIPTNLDVADVTRGQFPSFYAALFDRTVAGHPRAVVTEYAWSSASCNPCPVAPLGAEDLRWLGADVIDAPAGPLVLTRLHARYTRETAGDDLVFRLAPGVSGGRETLGGPSPTGAHPTAGGSDFQARYVIRHRWEGAVACTEPRFGVWGEPPSGERSPPVAAAARGAVAARSLPLDQLVVAEGEPQRARSSVRAVLAALLGEARSSPWSVVVALVLGAVLVLGAALRAGGGVVAPLGTFALFAVMPGLLATNHRGFELLREAGGFAVPEAVVFVLALAVILVLRLRRAGDGALLVVALAPFGAGLLGTAAHYARSLGAAGEASAVGTLRARILAGGQSEALAVLVVGLVMASILCVLSASPPRDRESEALPAQLYAYAVPVGAALGLVVSMLLPGAFALDRITPDLVLLVVTLASVLIAARFFMLTDREQAALPTLRACVALGVAAGLAACAGLAYEHRWGLGALAGESVAPDQRIQVLLHMLHRERVRAALVPLDVFVAVAPALWTVRAAVRRDRGGALALAPGLFALALLLAAAGWQHASLDADLGGDARGPRFASGPGLTLPAVGYSDDIFSGQDRDAAAHLGGPAVWVTAQGALLASPAAADPPRAYEPAQWAALAAASRDTDAAAEPLLAADAGLRFDALLGALAPLLSRRQTEFLLVQDVQIPDPGRAVAYQGVWSEHRPLRFAVDFLPELSISPGARPGLGHSVLGLLPAGDRARAVVLEGRRGWYGVASASAPRDLPLGLAEDDRRERRRLLADLDRLDEVVLGCPPSMEVGALSRALLALSETLGERTSSRPASAGRPAAPRFILSTDAASLERAAAAP